MPPVRIDAGFLVVALVSIAAVIAAAVAGNGQNAVFVVPGVLAFAGTTIAGVLALLGKMDSIQESVNANRHAMAQRQDETDAAAKEAATVIKTAAEATTAKIETIEKAVNGNTQALRDKITALKEVIAQLQETVKKEARP